MLPYNRLSLSMVRREGMYARGLSLGGSGVMLVLFVLAPFCLLLRVSVAPMDIASLWGNVLILNAFPSM